MPWPQPLPVQPPRADRDLRLDDVPAGAQRVGFGIEEGQDAVFLVRPQEPEPRDRREQRQREAADADHAGDANHHHGRPARNSANTPLAPHQHARCRGRGCSRISTDRHGDDQQRHQQRADSAAAGARRCRYQASHHRQGELEQFGRLEVEDAEIDPVVAVLAAADEQHQHQRQQRQHVRPAACLLRRCAGGTRDSSHSAPRPTPKRAPCAITRRADFVAGAVQHGQADRPSAPAAPASNGRSSVRRKRRNRSQQPADDGVSSRRAPCTARRSRGVAPRTVAPALATAAGSTFANGLRGELGRRRLVRHRRLRHLAQQPGIDDLARDRRRAGLAP